MKKLINMLVDFCIKREIKNVIKNLEKVMKKSPLKRTMKEELNKSLENGDDVETAAVIVGKVMESFMETPEIGRVVENFLNRIERIIEKQNLYTKEEILNSFGRSVVILVEIFTHNVMSEATADIIKGK